MNRLHSRRSVVIAGMSALGLAAASNGSHAFGQTPAATPEAINSWESSLFGDRVTWDESRLLFDEFSSRLRLGNYGELDKVSLLSRPKGSASVVSVSFQPFPFDSLDEVAAEFPENQWNTSVLTARYPRDAKLTESAYGYFYTEQDGTDPKVHYCGYIEFALPTDGGSAWSIFEVWTDVKYEWWNIDAMADAVNALEINGKSPYRAWTFDEVMAAFAEEMEVVGG